MKKNILILFLLFFVFTGCSANYKIEVFDGKIKEELLVIEPDRTMANKQDDMGMSFRDYALEYGALNDYFTSYYNMYGDDTTVCQETTDNDCSVYDKEYIDDSSGIGFQLSSSFSFEEYADATIPNDLMPGFSSIYDGRYLTISGGSNWDFMKGYPDLEAINITIKSNYYVTSTNAKNKGNGTYEFQVTKDNYENLDSLYIIFDTSSTRRLHSEYSWIVAVVMTSLVLLLLIFFVFKIVMMNRKNNRL